MKLITLAALATQILLIFIPGLVLHRALACRILLLDQPANSESKIRESDLVVYGLLPGLTIVNTVGTILALCGLFRLSVFIAVLVALTVWRWRDAAATIAALRELCCAPWQSLARGNLLILVAIGIFLAAGFGLLVEAQLPSGNIDVWNHNLPLAQSIVRHSGFLLPQIPHPFYGTYPIFFHMFFAEGLLFVDNVIAAKVINALIYLGFLLSLVFCARRARAVATVVVFVLIINDSFFSNGASDVMTDVPRVAFSVLALTFAYLYLRDRQLYFLFAAGLLAGGAVAGKYTELLIPVLIAVTLLPKLVTRSKEGWIAAVVFFIAFLPVACYPYLRNWILLSNPIYPFLFAHAGLSDQYMADLNAEVFHSLDPAFRNLSKDFLTWQAWRDFATGTYEVFLSRLVHPYFVFGLISIGLVLRRSRIIYPVVWTFVLWLFWYVVGTLNTRWGLTPYMMLLTVAFLSWAWLVDIAVATFEPWGRAVWLVDVTVATAEPGAPASPSPRQFPIGLKKLFRVPIPTALTLDNFTRAVLTGLALYLCIPTVRHVRDDGLAGFLPDWADRQQGKAVLSGELDTYLAKTRPGFEIYRFIGDHDLRSVMQPFDNGAWFYQSAYNGGHNGNWIYPWYQLPAKPADYNEFLRSNDIKYFIYRELQPLETERLGPKHVELANALIRQLLPRSHRILIDPFGWELYAIDQAPVPGHSFTTRERPAEKFQDQFK
jgi:hypothetical protein